MELVGLNKILYNYPKGNSLNEILEYSTGWQKNENNKYERIVTTYMLNYKISLIIRRKYDYQYYLFKR